MKVVIGRCFEPAEGSPVAGLLNALALITILHAHRSGDVRDGTTRGSIEIKDLRPQF